MEWFSLCNDTELNMKWWQMIMSLFFPDTITVLSRSPVVTSVDFEEKIQGDRLFLADIWIDNNAKFYRIMSRADDFSSTNVGGRKKDSGRWYIYSDNWKNMIGQCIRMQLVARDMSVIVLECDTVKNDDKFSQGLCISNYFHCLR